MLVLLGAAWSARAQDTGYISGTVTDKSGAVVAGAEVTLSSTGGALTRITPTNADGAYVISGLPGGTYDLLVTAKGFQKYTAQKVVLDVAAKVRVDVQLTVGSMSEEVVVTGESVAQVETQSSEISSTITGKQVNQLELNGRNFVQLLNLSPGVVNQTGQDEGTVGVNGNVSFSVNGGRVEYNNWEIDGGDTMDNGSNDTINVYPNLEAISEVKVLTSNYGAQYGRNGSGTVEVETKSGTSSFHGSAFEYLRNDMFNAKPWESGGEPGDPNPPYKKHDFGYTFGGPIYIPHHYNADKKKTFFFWSQEWRRQKDPYTVLQNVPSAAERTGNFSDLCPAYSASTPVNTTNFPDCPTIPGSGGIAFANNTITPTAVGTALLAQIPTANTTTNGFPAVGEDISLPTTWREELIRVDHNLSDKYRLTFRYIHDSWQTQTPMPLWGNGSSFENINTNFVGPGTSFVARLNANFSPTLLNEFVASYTADHIFLNTINNPPLPSGFASEMGSLFDNGFDGKLPSVVLSNNAAYGGGFMGDTGYFPWNNANPTYTYRDNMTKILGNHTLTFGAYFVAAQKNEDNSPYNQGILTFSSTDTAITTGNAFADMLLGNVANYSQTNSTIKYYNRWKILEPYFQDDWRMNKHLTLNLGLRLSLFGTYREKYQHAFAFYGSDFVAGASPTIDVTGNTTGTADAFIPGTGNPFNGVVQCGGNGGTGDIPSPVVTSFPAATVGGSSNSGCMSGHLFNPAPRIGFAWDPKGDGKMAIRGGYGIFFEHTNGNEGNTESLEGSPPFAFTAQQNNIAGGFGTCPAGESGYSCIGGAGLLFPFNVTNIPSHVQWPYVQQWNLGIQKELPSHIIGSIAYVGSKGTHLTLESDLNQLQPVPAAANPYTPGQPITQADCNGIVTSPTTGLPVSGSLGNGTVVPTAALNNLFVACGGDVLPLRPYLGFASITSLQDSANSIYNALQATANRTIGDLTLSVAYTYSHSIDDSSDRFDSAFVNSYDPAANRGSSTFDQRHAASISYVYALPFFKGSGLSHTLLGGWQLSGITIAQTGTPFSVTNGLFGDSAGVGNGVGTGSRPDLVGNPYSVTSADQAATAAAGIRGQLYYNPNAFAQPTGLTFGDVGRDTLYLPGRLNFDFGLFKRFQFGESKELDFRWENFNLFNHTQFNAIDSANNDPNFLVLDGAHAPRRMQFGLRLQF
jgi:Carboxypeptidase regulatory-like domain/TonB-dependent Receptor Plug Domain